MRYKLEIERNKSEFWSIQSLYLTNLTFFLVNLRKMYLFLLRIVRYNQDIQAFNFLKKCPNTQNCDINTEFSMLDINPEFITCNSVEKSLTCKIWCLNIYYSIIMTFIFRIALYILLIILYITLYIAVYICQFWEKVLSWDIRYKLRIVKYKLKIITLNLGTVGLWTEVH